MKGRVAPCNLIYRVGRFTCGAAGRDQKRVISTAADELLLTYAKKIAKQRLVQPAAGDWVRDVEAEAAFVRRPGQGNRGA